MTTATPTEHRAVDSAAQRERQHEPYTYRNPGLKHDSDAKFAELVLDITSGIDLCVGLLDVDQMRRDDAGADMPLPLFGSNDTSRMLRFVLAAARMLGDEAGQRIEWMNDQDEKGRA